MAKGRIDPIAGAARIVDGGEITSLVTSFFTSAGTPFSLKLIPKSDSNIKEFEYVKVRLYQGEDYVTWPVDVLSWTSEMFIGVHLDSATILSDYRVFYGTGLDI